jgi:hypothetical protein
MNFKTIKTWLATSITLNFIFITFFMYLFLFSIKTDSENFKSISLFVNAKNNPNDKLIDLTTYDSLSFNNFPYNDYIKYTDLQDQTTLDNDLEILKAKTNNDFLSNNILVTALTEKLYSEIWSTDLDTINQIMVWVDQLNFKESDIEVPISLYWYNHFSNHFSKLANQNPNSKYEFKYRYLSQRCNEKLVLVNTGNSNFEKVILNIIDQNWSYLFNRFWFSSSVLFKIILLVGLIPLVILLTLGIKYIILLIKNKY